MIRIAQQGRATTRVAETMDEVVAGVGVHWIEIDGVRVTAESGLASVDLRMSRGEINGTAVTLHLFGPVQVVYLDRDGNELGPGPVIEEDWTFDHATVTRP